MLSVSCTEGNVTTARLGYFEDFKSNDTLLIEASAEVLRQTG